MVKALQQALARNGTMGTRRGKLVPAAREAVEKDLASLSANDSAAVFWNLEDMRLSLRGSTREETLARVVRWFEGFLDMPVQRVEVSKFVEPWDRPGSSPTDWLYPMTQLGMYIHRVWPPKSESLDMKLTATVRAIAQASGLGVKDIDGKPLPRLLCIFSEDMFYDDALREAQQVGISTLWFGMNERAIYYPAYSDQQVRIDVIKWDRMIGDVTVTNRNPFTPGVATPDAPLAVWKKDAVPPDFTWGKGTELDLGTTDVRQILVEALRDAKVEA